MIPYLHLDHRIKKQKTDPKTGQFLKGNNPWNKGTHFNTGGVETQFNKGNIPHNTRPDGFESFRKDHSKQGYIYIKADGKMRPKHRWLWNHHFGPIPKNCIIIFRDGNPLKCTIENLALISKSVNLRRNTDIIKRGESIGKLWRREKYRKRYGMPALSKFYKCIVNF
jgi:hypothetical protein